MLLHCTCKVGKPVYFHGNLNHVYSSERWSHLSVFRYNCRPYIIPQLLREQRQGGVVPAPSVATAAVAAVLDPTAR